MIKSLDLKEKKFQKAAGIIAGDFNLDAAGSSSRQKDGELLKSLEGKLHLDQLIRKPTRVTVKKSSLIDLLFLSINDIKNVFESDSVEYNISDHDLIYLVYKKEQTTRPSTSFSFRSRKKYNRAVLMYRLENWDWSDFYEASTPDAAWTLLHKAYIEVLNDIAPFQTKENVPYRDEWVDNECILKMKERDSLRGSLRYTNDDILAGKFREARKLARQLMNRARWKYILEGLQEDQFAPKKYWRRLKQLMFVLLLNHIKNCLL